MVSQEWLGKESSETLVWKQRAVRRGRRRIRSREHQLNATAISLEHVHRLELEGTGRFGKNGAAAALF